MIFSETPLALVAADVRKSADPSAFAKYGLVMHTPAGNVDILRLLNVDILGNYISNYCEEIKLTFVIGEGAYRHKLLPNIHNLEASLYKRRYNPFDIAKIDSEGVTQQRYTALILGASDNDMTQDALNLSGEGTLDLSQTRKVTIQLFSKAMEQFRMRSCGGIYRRSAVGDVIKTILMGESSAVNVVSDYTPQGIDMVDPLDARLREHIVIPHGTRSYDAPGYIHKHCGGVYSAGLSYYYHDDMWYVYPTFDYTRYHTAKQQLTMVIVPEKAMPFQEYTFATRGQCTTILVTGEVSTTTVADQAQLQSGNGLRFTDPLKLFGEATKVEDNRVTYNRAEASNEFITTKRENGFNNVVNSSNSITSNRLFELSRLASRNGKIVTMAWQNSRPELITPGMQVKTMHMVGDQIRETYGVVLGVDTSISYNGTGIVAGNYSCNSAIMVYMESEST